MSAKVDESVIWASGGNDRHTLDSISEISSEDLRMNRSMITAESQQVLRLAASVPYPSLTVELTGE